MEPPQAGTARTPSLLSSAALVSAPAHGQPPHVALAVLHCLIGLAALLVTAAALDAWLPAGRHTGLAAKLAELERRADRVDTLFVGSSLTFRHVDPAAFDAITAAAGRPTVSFNLGAPGLGAVELDWLLERLRERELPALRRVLLDPYSVGWELPEANVESARVLAWHDASRTALALRLVEEARLPFDRRLALWRNHLRAFGVRLGALGRLREVLEEHLFGDDASRAAARAQRDAEVRRSLGPAGDGFQSLDRALADADDIEREQLLARAAALAERVAEYRAALAGRMRRGDGGPTVGDPGPATTALLASLARRCEALGARLIVFDAPEPEARDVLFRQARALGIADGAITLDDPRRFPELFRFERRFDSRHLDEIGAAAFTAALAEGFLALSPEATGEAEAAAGNDAHGAHDTPGTQGTQGAGSEVDDTDTDGTDDGTDDDTDGTDGGDHIDDGERDR